MNHEYFYAKELVDDAIKEYERKLNSLAHSIFKDEEVPRKRNATESNLLTTPVKSRKLDDANGPSNGASELLKAVQEAQKAAQESAKVFSRAENRLNGL